MIEPDASLRMLAARHGVSVEYVDTVGALHTVSDATLRAMLSAIDVDAESDGAVAAALATAGDDPFDDIPVARWGKLDLAIPGALEWRATLEDGTLRSGQADGHVRISGLPVGLHDLEVRTSSGLWRSPLPAPPPRAPSARDLSGKARHWGVAAPIYALQGPLGLGTYAGVGELAAGCGALGASYVLLNPAHALFPEAPLAYSPYSPSHRRFFNIAHIDPVAAAAAIDAHDLDPSSWAAAGDAQPDELIDYPAHARAHRQALDALFAAFDALVPGHPRREAFDAWRREHGAALERYALYEAIAETFGPFWTEWLADLRDPGSLPADAAPDRSVRKHAFFQWLADTQLADAQARAKAGGMAFGLMLDLAVGVRADGAEVWAEPANFARGVSIGAPPDAFNPNGQNWALAPLNPRALRAGGLRAFAETLRASMRRGGALRIDHVLGLRRNFWLAERTGEGAYVRFPMDALFAVAAIEAHRNQCLVVGEDLGNVPKGFRREMSESGLYGCRLLYFQHTSSGALEDPTDYAPNTVASIGSHDLATLAEWWEETDLQEMSAAGVLAAGDVAAASAQRAVDRQQLSAMIGLEADSPVDAVVARTYALLAKSGSDFVTVQLEMLLPGGARLNLPGTTDQYPNWRRRWPELSRILSDAGLLRIATAMREVGDR